MPELVELTSREHARLRVAPGSGMAYASGQHLLNLQVTEVGKAACSFPLFLTRIASTGHWAISAMTSFRPGHNLFVDAGHWQATYQPSDIQTYPLGLIRSTEAGQGYRVGIDPSSQAFSTREGEPLFDQQGADSLYLSRTRALLDAEVKHVSQTRQFTGELDAMGLIRAIDLQVRQEDDSAQTIRGLCTIDEDALAALSAERLAALAGRGYLVAIHAILISIYQLNTLIQRHNRAGVQPRLSQVKLESARDAHAG